MSSTLAEQVADLREAVDANFVLTSAYIVFLMQGGFAMLEAGSVRSKNVRNVLLKNVLDACAGTIAFWIFGWAFAYGPSSSWPRFIGSGQFVLSNGFGEDLSDPGATRMHDFLFQWTFAASTATIVSGSVAERTSFYSYIAYSLLLTGFVYPVAAHWLWSSGGWLANLYGSSGAIDYAGCTAVHLVGGVAGLIGAATVGPRIGRFGPDGKPVPMPGHSASLATLGLFMLWFGWYGFNPGSVLQITDKKWAVAERCAVTTTISAATGGITSLIIYKIRDHIFDLGAVINGILAGLVAICSTTAMVQPYIVVVVGAIGAVMYFLCSTLLLRLQIDDPLDAFAVHTGPAVWGAIAAGLFNERRFQMLVGYTGDYYGLFYGGGGRLLGANIVAILAIGGWTVITILPLFLTLRVLGILRITEQEELIGNDISKHGGTAYPLDVVSEMLDGKIIDEMPSQIADDAITNMFDGGAPSKG